MLSGMESMKMGDTSDVVSAHGQLKVVELSSLVLQALFALFLYHYVTRLERIGCECAIDRTRTYIQYYSLGLFAIVVIKLALYLSGSESTYIAFSAIIAPFLFVATVVYVIYVIKYINRLRREKCKCSATISRAVIYIYAIIQAIMFAYLALVMLSMIIVLLMSIGK